MKTILYFTLTLLTFVTLTFVPKSYAQFTTPEFVVRQIYFHPSDRQPTQTVIATLDTLVKEVQQFYADEMERHEFGRKTFRLERDEFGDVVRHYVKGKFTTSHYRTDIIGGAHAEINIKFDTSHHFFYLVFIEGGDDGGEGQVGGNGGGTPFTGTANITLFDFHITPERLHRRAFNTIFHEMGHAFGLLHDFRDYRYMMSYGPKDNRGQLSYCAAQWLDVHRCFNTTHNTFNQLPTIRMLESSFISAPNTIHLRFELTHSARLHQAILLSNSFSWPGNSYFDPTAVLDCKRLNGNDNTIEFETTKLAFASEYVMLRVIDKHGNFTSTRFPIDMTSLLPNSEPVSIPDENLVTAIRKNLNLPLRTPITKLDMLGLGRLHDAGPHRIDDFPRNNPEKQIEDITGLHHAINLEFIELHDNRIVDLTPIAGLTQLKSLLISNNSISDISPLAGLTQLTTLHIAGNKISNLRPLEGLTKLTTLHIAGNKISNVRPLEGLTVLDSLVLNHNQISDISPLTALKNLRTLRLGGNRIDVEGLTILTEFSMLDDLSLGRNQIQDITPLAKLTSLNSLYLAGNRISDITPLKELTNLFSLYLSSNEIMDIMSLNGLTNLRRLELNSNRITDISPLADLTNLRILILVENQIKDREPLLALLRKNPDVKIYLKDRNTPLPVTLSHFSAEHTNSGVILKWTTQSEVDNAGFYIYRSDTKDGDYTVINPTMIQGAGTTGERQNYTFTDTTAKPNTIYYYRIEDVSLAGEREQLATVRLKGLISPEGKLTTRWADLKN